MKFFGTKNGKKNTLVSDFAYARYDPGSTELLPSLQSLAELDEISRVQKPCLGTCTTCNTTESPELTSDWRVYDGDGVVTVVANGMPLTC